MQSPVTAPESANTQELTDFVAWASAVFYWAESPVNPSVRTYWDAVHYISTALSVGYANIFPMTQVGKIVGAVVMMVGPALSSHALDSPREGDAAVLSKLDEMLVELKKLNQQR
jgi:hypothetical protein